MMASLINQNRNQLGGKNNHVDNNYNTDHYSNSPEGYVGLNSLNGGL